MRGLFWVLALFALAVAVALGASLNDGYALIVLHPWRLEISLNFLVLGLVLLFIAFHVILRAWSLTMGMPRRVQEYLSLIHI